MIRGLALAALATGCFSEPPRPTCNAARKLEILNTPADESGPWLSDDRRELLFASDRDGSFDLYRATREDIELPFHPPVKLAGDVNTSESEADPFVMPDGKTVWFSSQRRGSGYGQIYVATRRSRDSGELTLDHEATELGEARHPTLTADGLTIYYEAYSGIYPAVFTATRSSTSKPFGPGRVMTEIEVELLEFTPSVSADGKTLIFGTAPPNDTARLMRAYRGSDGLFGTPEAVDEVPAPSSGSDTSPFLMPDGKTIAFASNRNPTGTNDYDLYVACE
jgi:Tol biopolymer transport system component